MKIVMREYKTIDADSMVHFLKEVEAAESGGQIHVILDNAAAH